MHPKIDANPYCSFSEFLPLDIGIADGHILTYRQPGISLWSYTNGDWKVLLPVAIFLLSYGLLSSIDRIVVFVLFWCATVYLVKGSIEAAFRFETTLHGDIFDAQFGIHQ